LLGTLPIETVADTSCAQKGGSEVEVYPTTASYGRFNRLMTVGARRVAQDAYVGGMWAMDMDGANAPADGTYIANMRNWIASDGATVSMVGVGELLHFRRFDDQGAPAGDLLDVSPDGPARLAVAANGSGALAAWAFDDTIRVRGIANDGSFAGPQVDVAPAEDGVTIAAAAAPSGFAVAWTSMEAPGDYRTYFLRTALDGTGGTPLEVTRGAQVHEVVRLVPTTSGHVLLINGGLGEWASYALMFDDQGDVASPAYELEGADFVWDAAAFGDELSIVATRAGREPQFRAFDATFSAMSSWVCLDAATSASEPIAIDVDPNGYAVLYRTANDAINLVRFDHVGQ
jgi:hypothetical protein